MKSMVQLLLFLGIVALCNAQVTSFLKSTLSQPETFHTTDVQDESRRPVFNFELTNTNANDNITILIWNTPFEKNFYSSIFIVRDVETNETMQYVGPRAKRLLPSDPRALRDLFVTLHPSDSITATVDLSSYYAFTKKNHHYSVALDTVLTFFSGTIEDLDFMKDPTSYLSAEPYTSQSFSFKITQIPQLPNFSPSPKLTQLLGVNYIGCNPTYQSRFPGVIAKAKLHTNQALSFLNSANCDKPYVTWFGSYAGTTRWSTVKIHFLNAKSRFDAEAYNLQCEACQNGILAYVYPTDKTHTIHFCDYSWTTSLMDQASTVIHEMTHFVDVGNTDDFVYGVAEAQNLARTRPDKAIMCAENHNFFAEYWPTC